MIVSCAQELSFAGNPHPVVLQKTLTQDNSGNISGTGTATANGSAGNYFTADLSGSSLSNATDISVDYLGNTCAGTDSGTRTLAGTINSSNQVTMTINAEPIRQAAFLWDVDSLRPLRKRWSSTR